MSDEALNKHLDWLDKCAKEQEGEVRMTNKCRHAIVCSCEKAHSHLFVRIGYDDKAECPHCQNADLLEALVGITEQAETVLDLLDKHDAVKKPCKKAYEIRRGQLAYTIEHANEAISKAKENCHATQ